MSIYVIADLHLSFCPEIDKPMGVFGGSWENHEERLEKAWKESVSPEDTVVIVGDISWGIDLPQAGFDLEWIHALPGRKVLVKGNHDLWWNGINRLNKLYEDMSFLQNDCVIAGGLCICGSRGWITPDNEDYGESDERVYKREILRLEMSLEAGRKAMEESKAEKIVGVMHYPPVIDRDNLSGFHRLFKDYGVEDVYFGHLHGEETFRSAVMGDVDGIEYHLISLDYLDCRPLKI